MAYLHGAYGDIQAAGNRVAAQSEGVIVAIGTAPVHTVAGGAANVNKPVLVTGIAEARQLFGYSDDWAKYTLCEAMHVFFELNGVGPLVLINVLDPATHKKSGDATSKSLTPVNGVITIANAEGIILDTVTVAGKTKGTDFTVAYNQAKKTIVITGNLGTAAINVSYNEINAAAVTAEAVIGSTDGMGLNTGVYALKNVYQETGLVPAFVIAPGFSSVPAIHSAMAQVTRKINGHWDAWMFADLPIMNDETPVTMATDATFKAANGYNQENETVCYPMATGTDGKQYHLSTLRAANFLDILGRNDGIPYHTASNTVCAVIASLWLGAEYTGRVFDDQIINENLCKHGITSAAFVGGRWVLWGAHAADYDTDNQTAVNTAETSRMMLFYLSNDFQQRRVNDVDKPVTANDIQSLVADEQARLDALVRTGALIYGQAAIDAQAIQDSDVFLGDYMFTFDVTTTPLAKSLTVTVNWVNDGYATYFAEAETDMASDYD